MLVNSTDIPIHSVRGVCVCVYGVVDVQIYTAGHLKNIFSTINALIKAVYVYILN